MRRFFSSSPSHSNSAHRYTQPNSASNTDPPPSYSSVVAEQVQSAHAHDPEHHQQQTLRNTEQGEHRVYLFYRIFDEDGGVPSKVPVDANNPYIGSIDAYLITPPHTAASIKRCICRHESIDDHWSIVLYASASRVDPMDDTEHLSIFSGTGPGSTPRRPFAIVKRGVIKDEFNIAIKMKISWRYVDTFPEWLAYEKGEILHTDGVAKKAIYTAGTNNSVYRARNAAGKVGFVVISMSERMHESL